MKTLRKNKSKLHLEKRGVIYNAYIIYNEEDTGKYTVSIHDSDSLAYRWYAKNPIVDILNYGFKILNGKRIHNLNKDSQVIPGNSKVNDDVHGGDSETDDKIESSDPNQENNPGNSKMNNNVHGGDSETDDKIESSDPKKRDKNPSMTKLDKTISRILSKRQKKSSRISNMVDSTIKNGGLSPQAFRPTSEYKKYNVGRIRDIISKWVGNGIPEEEESLDIFKLTLFHITNQSIVPALYSDTEKENKMKVLLTNDVSGSCATHSGITGAIANALAEDASLDVKVIENVNGGPTIDGDYHEDLMKIYNSCDRVIYFGDSDGYSILEECTKKGAKIVILSNEHHNNRGPKIRERKDNFIIIDGVDLRSTDSIADALLLII